MGRRGWVTLFFVVASGLKKKKKRACPIGLSQTCQTEKKRRRRVLFQQNKKIRVPVKRWIITKQKNKSQFSFLTFSHFLLLFLFNPNNEKMTKKMQAGPGQKLNIAQSFCYFCCIFCRKLPLILVFTDNFHSGSATFCWFAVLLSFSPIYIQLKRKRVF